MTFLKAKFDLNLACKLRQSFLIFDKHVPLRLIICNKLCSQSSICFDCPSGQSCYLTSNSIQYPLQRPSICSNDYRYQTPMQLQLLRKAILSVKTGLQSIGYTRKSERSKRSEGSWLKASSRGYCLFYPLSASYLCARFLHRNRHQQYINVVRCLFCGKLLRYKIIILSVDKLFILLKIRVAVTVFR